MLYYMLFLIFILLKYPIIFFVWKRFCIDNGVMIAHTGALMHKSGYKTKWEDTFCTQK